MAFEDLTKRMKQNQKIKDLEKQVSLASSQEDAANKARELLKNLPQYQDSLKGKEWEQAYGEAYGTGPMAAYEALRKGATEREANEQQRLAAALQDELQGVDVGRAGQLVNAYGGLAMGGGLSSGARERLGASSLESAMGQRQAQRLQSQRSLFDLGAKTREQMLGIGAEEAKTRMGMQEAIVKAKQAEELRRQQMEMERANKMADFEASQLAAQQQQQIAQASAPKGGK